MEGRHINLCEKCVRSSSKQDGPAIAALLDVGSFLSYISNKYGIVQSTGVFWKNRYQKTGDAERKIWLGASPSYNARRGRAIWEAAHHKPITTAQK